MSARSINGGEPVGSAAFCAAGRRRRPSRPGHPEPSCPDRSTVIYQATEKVVKQTRRGDMQCVYRGSMDGKVTCQTDRTFSSTCLLGIAVRVCGYYLTHGKAGVYSPEEQQSGQQLVLGDRSPRQHDRLRPLHLKQSNQSHY